MPPKWKKPKGDAKIEFAGERVMATMLRDSDAPHREFNVIIERDRNGYYVATVPELRGCHTQAKSLDKLMERVREAILVCLDARGEPAGEPQFIGIQRIMV
jgi:predicted RNase H-like HicB family nuclease